MYAVLYYEYIKEHILKLNLYRNPSIIVWNSCHNITISDGFGDVAFAVIKLGVHNLSSWFLYSFTLISETFSRNYGILFAFHTSVIMFVWIN